MTFDAEAAFLAEFEAEAGKRFERGFTPADFRAAGRRSKEWPEKENAAWWRKNGPAMVERWIQWREANGYVVMEVGGVPAIELDLKATFGGVLVRCLIDRVMVTPDGEVIVVDLKTGSKTKKTTLQLGIYAMALEQATGIAANWGGFWHARSGSMEPVPLDIYDPEFWGRVFREVRADKEARRVLPIVGDQCGYCGVAAHCPALTGRVDPGLFAKDGSPLL